MDSNALKREAVETYHELLNERAAADTHAAIEALLRERKLFFGDRALCTVLRPNFYTRDQFQYLKQQTEILLRAFSKAHNACMQDPSLRRELHLAPWEEEMMTLPHAGKYTPWTTSRLDSFFSTEENSLQFVEYNAETPAGMGYEDVLAETFLDLPLMRDFQRRFTVQPLAVREHLLVALLKTYEQWLGRKPDSYPQIAIVDWEDVPTRNEHRICMQFFESQGLKTILADPRRLEYKNGRLFADDFRVDLIYKRVLAAELYEQMGPEHAVFQALRNGAVCLSNSFHALLMYKKSSFAFLSDENNGRLFTAEEKDAIRRHIPWTRMVANRKTYYNNSTIDLVSFISSNREKLVLKPNDSYGGKGVVLGWDASQSEWEKTLQTALDEPYVVQEKVKAASELFPSYAGGNLQMIKVYVDADPFIFMGTTVHGVLTRLSSAALLNVTAGGGSTVPTFLVDRK